MPPIETPTPNSDQLKKYKKQHRISSVLESFSILGLFLAAFLSALALNAFVFQPYEVDGQSMEPTLHNSDRLIVSKIGRTFKKVTGGDFVPDRGDIIVFKRNSSIENQLIKRVIGLPGDRVTINDSVITIYNDENPEGLNVDELLGLDLEPTYGDGLDVRVNSGEVFVAGDNRVQNASLDSRSSLGNVPVEDIIGVLSLRIYPISDFRAF